MTRVTTLLSSSVLLAACAADSSGTIPESFIGVDDASLAGAELPIDVVAASDIRLPANASQRPFAADPTLMPDGDAEGLLTDAARNAPPRFGRDALVAIRWGYFPPRPETDAGWVDWSGFVAVSDGSIEVIRTLRFENDGDDSRRPHEDAVQQDDDPRIVRFRSHTRPAWDGLLLRVHRDRIRPAVLAIKVGETERIVPFEELFELKASEALDDAGHELRIRGRTAALPECVIETGRAKGVWNAIDAMHGQIAGKLKVDDERYRLRGETLDVRGPYGLFRGGFGQDGDVVGRTRGFYAAFHYTPGAGVLVGVARSEDADLRGALLGRWHTGLDADASLPSNLPFDPEGAFRAKVFQGDPACGAE